MPIGPVELLVVKFPGNQFKGEIAPALRQLVENNTIRIIDLLFAVKDENGEVAMLEIKDLQEAEYAVFNPIVSDVTELLSDNDINQIAGMLENNSSAAVLLFENIWATRFRDAVLNAKGELIFNVRIPHDVVEETMAEYEEIEATI